MSTQPEPKWKKEAAHRRQKFYEVIDGKYFTKMGSLLLRALTLDELKVIDDAGFWIGGHGNLALGVRLWRIPTEKALYRTVQMFGCPNNAEFIGLEEDTERIWSSRGDSRYKVTWEYVLVDPEGHLFRVYDYKTSLSAGCGQLQRKDNPSFSHCENPLGYKEPPEALQKRFARELEKALFEPVQGTYDDYKV